MDGGEVLGLMVDMLLVVDVKCVSGVVGTRKLAAVVKCYIIPACCVAIASLG